MAGDHIPGPRIPHPAGQALATTTLEATLEGRPPLRYVAGVLALATGCTVLVMGWVALLAAWVVDAVT